MSHRKIDELFGIHNIFTGKIPYDITTHDSTHDTEFHGHEKIYINLIVDA